MADFAPVVVRRQSLFAPARSTAEEKLWGTYKSLAVESLPGVVNGVAFSPRFPYEMAAAADFSVSLINTTVGEVRKTIGRFKDVAHSPCFKPDGKLLVAGCSNGVTQVFDLSNRSILRQFKGHTGAVCTSKFSTDGLRVFTGSDDFSVRMWDLPTGKCMATLRNSTDYVRAQAYSPASKHVWCVGSYDRKARVYDLMSNEVVFTLDHGAQIDDMVMLPGGVRAVTVGGTHVKVWDFLTGGRCQYRLSNHAKAVTCCALYPSNDRLLTGGLDGQVKVHDLSSFRVSAAMYYDEAILSLAISADGKRIGTGSLNGCAEVRVAKSFQKDLPPVPVHGGLKERQFEGWGGGFQKHQPTGPKPGTRRYFERGAYAKPHEDDVIIGGKPLKAMKPYDRYLRSFSHGRALEAAAKTKDPAVVVSVIEELASRKALSNAMESCSEEAIEHQLFVIKKNIDLPVYTGRMIALLNILLDARGGGFGEGEPRDDLVIQILKKVRKLVELGRSLTQLEGMLQMLTTVSRF